MKLRSHWWRRAEPATEQDRQRAEALVEVERLGMMGGKPPELRLQRSSSFSPDKPMITYNSDEASKQ